MIREYTSLIAISRRGLSFGQDGGSGQFSYPKKKAVVHVKFNNGNIYSPEYYGIQELATDLKNVISSSYTNAHSLVYDSDEEFRMIYTQQDGLIIYNKHSNITIANDNAITIEHNNNKRDDKFHGHH